nr:MAG TPA: hypothetical protein [Caudoviricetes sp.]
MSKYLEWVEETHFTVNIFRSQFFCGKDRAFPFISVVSIMVLMI